MMYQVPPGSPPPAVSPLSIWIGTILAGGLTVVGGWLLLHLQFDAWFSVIWCGGTLLGAGLTGWVTWRRFTQGPAPHASAPLLFWSVLGLATLWLIGTLLLVWYFTSSIA